MTDKPRRRGFAFSLRAMFVAVTVLGCVLGWQLNVVRERQAALEQLKIVSGVHITTAEAWTLIVPNGIKDSPAATIPFVRRWLGDEAIQIIYYTPHLRNITEPELKRLVRLFPEAQLQEVLPEPCHPGCFPRGSQVETSAGPRLIETLQPGDEILAINASGEPVTATVQSCFRTQNQIWKIETENGNLFTTQTQPLCLNLKEVLQAGKLQRGNVILRRVDAEIQSVKVLSVSSTDRTESVFNLIVDDAEVFVVNGYLARCKPPAQLSDL